ncbi:PAS domain S-box protein [Halovenus sp. HT40]|uniref:PAS domain S-box protein n=1 Tax=Halovenus sp. HT40 TaxID=3126691 RepID=UPI00300E90FA
MGDSAGSGRVDALPPGLAGLDEPVFLLDETGVVRNCNEQSLAVTGLDRSNLLGTAAVTLTADADERFGEAVERATETGSATVSVTLENGEQTVPLDCALSTIQETNGEDSGIICIGHRRPPSGEGRRDRLRRQEVIETLQDATEQIQQAETVEEVVRVAVEATTSVFGLPYAVCWFHDADREQLEPEYATEKAHEQGFVGSFSAGSYEYEAFLEGQPTSYTPREVTADNSLSNAILLPLGEHGMIGVGGERAVEFDETVVDLSRTLAEHTTTALERVTRTQQLREEQALTESIFVALPDVFYAFDEEGQFFRWNDQLSKVTGYEDEEIASMHPAEFFPPEDREAIYTAIADVFQNDTTITIEARFETKDGEQIPYEFTGAKLTDETGESLGLVGIGRNISERKQRQRRFEAVFNNTYQFTGLMEPDGTLIEANDTALEFIGHDSDLVIGQKVWDAPWFTHSQAVQDEVKATVEQAAGGEFVRTEVTIQGVDREAIIDFSVRPVTDEHGDITLLIPEGRDITELKERERELRRERDHIRRTEAQADVGGWEVDLEAETLYWTDGLRDLYDVSPSFEPTYEDAIGYFHPESWETVANALEACRVDGTPFDIEAQILTAAGRTRWVQIEGERVEDDDAPKLRGVVRDITDRKEREQRLMVLNRVLRHNLRNKLTVVTGYADHVGSALQELDVAAKIDPSEAKDRLRSFPLEDALASVREIQASSDDLTELSQKVRKFGETIEKVDITDSVAVWPVVTDLGAGYAEEYPNASIDLDVDDVEVKGNREFLRLVVGELVENAIQHNHQPEPTVELCVTTDSEERVRIRVADDGPGIPDIEREVLREGEEESLLHGSGIGLWTVHWLVTRVGGTVSIEDNDPTGTVVTVTVPQAEPDDAA